MKFPLTEINVDDHKSHINALLLDDSCHILIDTNILALLYRLHSSARKEFFDWITPNIQKNRFHVPLWVMNEYASRYMRNQLDDYFTPIKKFSTTQKELSEICTFLKMNVETKTLVGTSYGSLEEYHNDLDDLEKKLKKISVAAKTKNESYKNEIHREITTMFQRTVIQSNLPGILQTIAANGQIRFNHKIPPGFDDSSKDFNTFGDLAIWIEILEFCSTNQHKKAILITNDNKKDWVYAPNRVIENGVSKGNAQNYKIADPRLVYEFQLQTESDEFHIINFETLTQILIKQVNGGFLQLAQALQIATEQDLRNNFIEGDPIVPEASTTNSTQADSPIDPPQTQVSEDDIYSRSALEDGSFEVDESSRVGKTIKELKSYNWYIQNPALKRFFESDLSKVENNQGNRDKLFVLGRNINQAASGGSAVAIEKINDLAEIINRASQFTATHIYAGILYEIYFNSTNTFRNGDYKGAFVNEILKHQVHPKVRDAVIYVNKKLTNHKKLLFVLPDPTPKKVTLTIVYDEKPQKVNMFLDIEETFHSVLDVKLNDISVITNDEDKSLFFQRIDGTVSDVIERLSRIYVIPKIQIELDAAIKELSQTRLLLPTGKFLKRLE